jgi:hypothetical protein
MIPESTIKPDIILAIRRVKQLQDIQKNNPFNSPDWQYASEQLRPLFKKLEKAKAPHRNQISWGK